MSEINNIKPLLQPGVGTPRQVAGRNNANPENSQPAPALNADTGDKVSLTETATQLQGLRQKIADLPDVNATRVATIKAAIEDGSYQIDSQELARKMIDFEGDF